MSLSIEQPDNAGVIDTLQRSAFTRQHAEAFLFREAACLDDKAWDDWLAHYSTDAEFWMPAWDDDDKLTEDPQSEISLIWYGDRGGLEDRVFRIRTERSSATSLPEPRTSHTISNVEVLDQTSDTVDIRYNWVTFSFRYQTTDTYFGTTYCTLDISGERPLITRKKVVLKNDYIHHVVDIYHL